MLPTLPLFLFAAIVVIVGVFCFMFVSVAFGGPAAATARATTERWQPPLDSDDTLVRWAAHMAEKVTATRLAMARSSTTATELAQDLYAGTTEALEQLREEEAQCSARCHEMIGLTAPEALALADSLKSRRGAAEIGRIRRVAATNAKQTAGMSRAEYSAARVTCPLLTNDGTCAAYAFRPLACRTDCSVCGGDDSAEPQSRVSSSSLAFGIERGLSKSLAAAGVDANRYELNGVLLSALNAPDVSDRWASGEAVFAECKPFGV